MELNQEISVILILLVLSHASTTHGFLLILGNLWFCMHIGSDVYCMHFNSNKFVLFAHVKFMRNTDFFFLPILWHEVGMSFLGVSEFWLQGKKLTLCLEELFSAIKQAATGKRVWLSLCCKGKVVL